MKSMLSLKKLKRIALSSNDDKIIQSTELIEINAHRISKDLACRQKNLKVIT